MKRLFQIIFAFVVLASFFGIALRAPAGDDSPQSTPTALWQYKVIVPTRIVGGVDQSEANTDGALESARARLKETETQERRLREMVIRNLATQDELNQAIANRTAEALNVEQVRSLGIELTQVQASYRQAELQRQIAKDEGDYTKVKVLDKQMAALASRKSRLNTKILMVQSSSPQTAAEKLENSFNELGARGWELIGYTETVAVFKRPIS